MAAFALPSAQAQTAVFNPANSQLTLPSIRIGLTTYNNVVLRLDSVAVISADPVSGTIAETCIPSNFNADKFNAVVPGMTLNQVNQLMGCKPNPARTNRSSSGYVTYEWDDQTDQYAYLSTRMEIYFDAGGSTVTPFTIGTSYAPPYRSGKGF